jgi:hypothetical protein
VDFNRDLNENDILEHFHPLSSMRAQHPLRVSKNSYNKNIRRQFRKSIYIIEDMGDNVLIGLKEKPKWTKKQTKLVIKNEIELIQNILNKLIQGLSQW